MTVADRIRSRREELNISQEELARMIGNKDKSTISKIEKSGDNVTMKNINRIAEALNVTSQYLLGWEQEKEQLEKEIFKNVMDLCGLDEEKDEDIIRDLQNKLISQSRTHNAIVNSINKIEENAKPLASKALNDNMQIIENLSTLPQEEINFLSNYINARPEVRSAIQTILKLSQ